MRGYGSDPTGSGQNGVASFCEYGDEHSDSEKAEKLDEMGKY
jgi:hypothetical protein